MATLTIKEIYRDQVTTKYGERESVRLVPHEETVLDINGDEIPLNGRKVTGFKDKKGETDEWRVGTKVKVQITTKKGQGKDGDEMEWVNFRLPEDQSSIVEQPDPEVVEPEDDF